MPATSLKDSIEIKYLADVPHLIPTLAQLIYEAWGKYDPTLTLDSQLKSLSAKLNTRKLLLVLLAFHNNTLVATVVLKDKIHLNGYEDRTLWLGSVIVLEPYRHQGIGSHLIQHSFDKAWDLGYSKISLFTSNIENGRWYTQHG